MIPAGSYVFTPGINISKFRGRAPSSRSTRTLMTPEKLIPKRVTGASNTRAEILTARRDAMSFRRRIRFEIFTSLSLVSPYLFPFSVSENMKSRADREHRLLERVLIFASEPLKKWLLVDSKMGGRSVTGFLARARMRFAILVIIRGIVNSFCLDVSIPRSSTAAQNSAVVTWPLRHVSSPRPAADTADFFFASGRNAFIALRSWSSGTAWPARARLSQNF